MLLWRTNERKHTLNGKQSSARGYVIVVYLNLFLSLKSVPINFGTEAKEQKKTENQDDDDENATENGVRWFVEARPLKWIPPMNY